MQQHEKIFKVASSPLRAQTNFSEEVFFLPNLQVIDSPLRENQKLYNQQQQQQQFQLNDNLIKQTYQNLKAKTENMMQDNLNVIRALYATEQNLNIFLPIIDQQNELLQIHDDTLLVSKRLQKIKSIICYDRCSSLQYDPDFLDIEDIIQDPFYPISKIDIMDQEVQAFCLQTNDTKMSESRDLIQEQQSQQTRMDEEKINQTLQFELFGYSFTQLQQNTLIITDPESFISIMQQFIDQYESYMEGLHTSHFSITQTFQFLDINDMQIVLQRQIPFLNGDWSPLRWAYVKANLTTIRLKNKKHKQILFSGPQHRLVFSMPQIMDILNSTNKIIQSKIGRPIFRMSVETHYHHKVVQLAGTLYMSMFNKITGYDRIESYCYAWCLLWLSSRCSQMKYYLKSQKVLKRGWTEQIYDMVSMSFFELEDAGHGDDLQPILNVPDQQDAGYYATQQFKKYRAQQKWPSNGYAINHNFTFGVFDGIQPKDILFVLDDVDNQIYHVYMKKDFFDSLPSESEFKIELDLNIKADKDNGTNHTEEFIKQAKEEYKDVEDFGQFKEELQSYYDEKKEHITLNVSKKKYRDRMNFNLNQIGLRIKPVIFQPMLPIIQIEGEIQLEPKDLQQVYHKLGSRFSQSAQFDVAEGNVIDMAMTSSNKWKQYFPQSRTYIWFSANYENYACYLKQGYGIRQGQQATIIGYRNFTLDYIDWDFRITTDLLQAVQIGYNIWMVTFKLENPDLMDFITMPYYKKPIQTLLGPRTCQREMYEMGLIAFASVNWDKPKTILDYSKRLIAISPYAIDSGRIVFGCDPTTELQSQLVEAMTYIREEQKILTVNIETFVLYEKPQYKWTIIAGLVLLLSLFIPLIIQLKTLQYQLLSFVILITLIGITLITQFQFINSQLDKQLSFYINYLGLSIKPISSSIGKAVHYETSTKQILSEMNVIAVRKFKLFINVFIKAYECCSCKPNDRKYLVNPLPKIKSGEIVAYNSCSINLLSSMTARVAFKTMRMQMYVVKNFSVFLRTQDNSLNRIITHLQHKTEFYNIQRYFDKIKVYDSKKSLSYTKAYYQFLVAPTSHNYESMVKTGEWFFRTYGKTLDNYNNRPRTIGNPPEAYKAAAGMVADETLQGAKEVIPEIGLGYDPKQMSKILTDAHAGIKNPVCIAVDLKSHDKNQHAILLRLVDEYLIMQPKVLSRSDIPFHLHKEVYDMCTRLTTKVVGYSQIMKKRRKVYSYETYGMVMSGHPTRTSLGNTVRVISYIEFVMWNARINRNQYRLFVAGDDIFIILEKELLNDFTIEFQKVFTTQEQGKWGLGQVTKLVNNLGYDGYEFLGRMGQFDKYIGLITFSDWKKQALIQVRTDSSYHDKNVLSHSQAEAFIQTDQYPHVKELLKYMPKPKGMFQNLWLYYNKVNSWYRQQYIKYQEQSTGVLDIVSYELQLVKQGKMDTIIEYGVGVDGIIRSKPTLDMFEPQLFRPNFSQFNPKLNS